MNITRIICCCCCAIDIDVNTLLRVLYSCLALHNYFELQKEKFLEKSIALTLNFEKLVQSVTSNLSLKRILNEKRATDILNTLTLFFE